MTDLDGPETVNSEFFQKCYQPGTEKLYPLKQLKQILADEFDEYQKKHSKKHPAAIGEQAEKFLRNMSNNSNVKIVIFTSNHPDYVEAVLTYSKIPYIEIKKTALTLGIDKCNLIMDCLNETYKVKLRGIYLFEDSKKNLDDLVSGAKRGLKRDGITEEEVAITPHLCVPGQINWAEHDIEIEQKAMDTQIETSSFTKK